MLFPLGLGFIRVGVNLLNARRRKGLYEQARRRRLQGAPPALRSQLRQQLDQLSPDQLIEEEREWDYQQLCQEHPLVPAAVETSRTAFVLVFIAIFFAIIVFLAVDGGAFWNSLWDF